VRSAQSGTLFLDVVEDLPPAAQQLLLRVLQEAEVLPLGAARPIKVDVRVLAATQRNLDALAEEQHFRSDLLARLSGVTLELPPLRERREDLGLLIRALLRRQLGDAANGSRSPARQRGRCSCIAGRSTCASWRTRCRRPWCSLGASRSDCVTFQPQ